MCLCVGGGGGVFIKGKKYGVIPHYVLLCKM